MLNLDNIKVEYEIQDFQCSGYETNEEKDKAVVFLECTRKTEEVCCCNCCNEVYQHDCNYINLTDMPIVYKTSFKVVVEQLRYRCKICNKTFNVEIPIQYPGTRITYRAANWIRGLLKENCSIRTIQRITGIHWDTIRKVQNEIMDETIWERENELKRQGYHPKILAVDEFAIHKGHSYATCVMDLETGDVLWVGKGRSQKDFEQFFKDVSSDALSEVIAVAMDMNASYNNLVTKYMPKAEIVYDRFHMQSQFGRDVLGVVRLDEARKHKAKSKELYESFEEDKSKREIKQEAKSERQQYTKLKKLRWPLLMNSENLKEQQNKYLDEILRDHNDLAVCYAMKEEICHLYELTDYQQALDGWTRWFDAAKASNIPALVKFASQKEKRLPGLAAHAIFRISTGKLEGFNNKIKVAKRIGYGYRDDMYFFKLIRYLSIPHLHEFP
ncbi:MAG: ISL3 family transposase [Clostridiales bacterium]|nr:ISL3 family transposase [Clostridiales bacterium]